MSNKCRGRYTIKGEGTEALAKELNKRAERHDTGLCNSMGKPTIAVMCYITSMLGPKWDANTDLEPVYLAGRGEEWPLVVKDGQVTFHAETLSSPPVDALTILSELYPIEIEMSYSLQCNNWEGGQTYRFREGKMTEVENDGRSAEDGLREAMEAFATTFGKWAEINASHIAQCKNIPEWGMECELVDANGKPWHLDLTPLE